MSKMKKRFVWVAVLAMVMSFAFSVPAYAEEQFTVHAQVPSDWGTPGLWAWSDPDLVNVFEAWPGQQLTADESNPGWFYYSIPTWANCIIVNDNGVGKQTVNLPIEAKEVWVTVTKANDGGQFEADVVYEAPEGFGAAASEVTPADTDTTATTADDTAVEDTAETAATTEVPKTGVSDFMYLYMGLTAVSGAGYIALKRKKTA